MSEAFIFIGTHRLKEGKLEAFKAYNAEFVRYIDEHEPQLRLFKFFLDEDAEHVSVVQLHPDAASMTLHMQVAQQHIAESYREYLDETVSIQIFGEPTEDVLTMTKQLSTDGVPVTVNRPMSGFDREATPRPTG